MRVCMIANTQAVHSQRWASALAARGHEVHLVGVRPAQVEGVKVHSVSGTRDIGLSRREVAFGYLRLALRMRRLLRHIAPDVVMAHYTTTNGVLATLARAHPLLVVPWGTDIRPEPDTFRRAWRDRINNWVLRHADGVAVSSHYLAQRVLQVGHGKTPQPTVIPFGVEPDRFTPPSESQRSNGPRIGFVKHFEPRYGAEVLLDAMQEVLRHVPTARLVMAGSGSLERPLRDYAAKLGVADHVEFVGHVPHDQVPDLMATFDLLANPSLEESFGVVLLEAASSALPVVASHVGGVDEIVDDGVTGLLVPPRDAAALAAAITRLARDPELRRRLGNEARRRVVDRFAWSTSVENMETLLGSLLTVRSGSRLGWVRRAADMMESSLVLRRTIRPVFRWAWDAAWQMAMRIRMRRQGPLATLDLDVGKVTVDLRDVGVARPLYRYHEYEPDERRLMERLVSPGMHVLDIGAHIGYHTLLLSRLVGKNGRVVALEAAPENFALLERNLRDNEAMNVTALNVAAAASRGTVALALDPSNFGAHHVVVGAHRGTIEVVAQTVDDVAGNHHVHPGFAKMDIEGAEIAALRGMTSVLEKYDITFLAELNRPGLERSGASAGALLDEFIRYGYTLYELKSGGELSSSNRSVLLAAAEARRNVNFVAARGAGIAAIADAYAQ